MIKEGDRLIKEASSKADGKLGGRWREGGVGGKWREGGAGGRWRGWKEAISRRCKVALARTDYSTRLRKLQKNWVAANHPIAGQITCAGVDAPWVGEGEQIDQPAGGLEGGGGHRPLPGVRMYGTGRGGEDIVMNVAKEIFMSQVLLPW